MARYIEPITNIPKASNPLSVMPNMMTAARQGAQTVMQGYEQNQAQERQLTERQMGIAFGNLLKTGVEGAQAYVEDLEDPEIKQAAQNRLNSLMPVLGNPQVQPEMAHKALLGFYQNVDDMNKSKNELGYKEKKIFDKEQEVNAFKEKEDYRNKNAKQFAPVRRNAAVEKWDAQKATAPIIKKKMEALPKPAIEDYVPKLKAAADKIEKIESELNKGKSNMAKLTEKGTLVSESKKESELPLAYNMGTRQLMDKYAEPEVRDYVKRESQLTNLLKTVKAEYEQALADVKVAKDKTEDSMAYGDFLAADEDYVKQMGDYEEKLLKAGGGAMEQQPNMRTARQPSSIQNTNNPIATKSPTLKKIPAKKAPSDNLTAQEIQTKIQTLQMSIPVLKGKELKRAKEILAYLQKKLQV